ncbi:hypothetical protein L345_16706, partial [Ophiophagus hannah]
MQGEVWKAQTLKELIEILHHLFASDKVNVAEVQTLMESYESNPEEWTKYAQFDQFRKLLGRLQADGKTGVTKKLRDLLAINTAN